MCSFCLLETLLAVSSFAAELRLMLASSSRTKSGDGETGFGELSRSCSCEVDVVCHGLLCVDLFIITRIMVRCTRSLYHFVNCHTEKVLRLEDLLNFLLLGSHVVYLE